MRTTNVKHKVTRWFCGHEVITVTYLWEGKPRIVCFKAEDRASHYSSNTCNKPPEVSTCDMDIAITILGGKPTISQAKEALADPTNAKLVTQLRAETLREGEG